MRSHPRCQKASGWRLQEHPAVIIGVRLSSPPSDVQAQIWTRVSLRTFDGNDPPTGVITVTTPGSFRTSKARVGGQRGNANFLRPDQAGPRIGGGHTGHGRVSVVGNDSDAARDELERASPTG